MLQNKKKEKFTSFPPHLTSFPCLLVFFILLLTHLCVCVCVCVCVRLLLSLVPGLTRSFCSSSSFNQSCFFFPSFYFILLLSCSRVCDSFLGCS